ncbi:MAG: hypothetical protein COA66_10430 [Arcobacter sp.]|nr:MAG: hypothetical protein COA66_10430 [Arcobacter sp.]
MKYKFKNKLLYELISHNYNINKQSAVFGLTVGKGLGSAALTFLVKRAFNIHRLPTLEDRHFTRSFLNNNDRLSKNNIFICEEFLENLDDMTDEIVLIYNHTQAELDKSYPEQEYIPLIRNLKKEYAALILKLKDNAEKKDVKYIEISSDIINCFTDNSNTYGFHVAVKLNIPKQNILYFDKTFKQGTIENNEFIVFNGDIKGLWKIPVDSISITSEEIGSTHDCREIKDKDSVYYYINFSSSNNIEFTLPTKKLNNKNESLLCRFFKRYITC